MTRFLGLLVLPTIATASRIIGGEPWKQEFPFVVGIMHCFMDSNAETACEPKCTGTLISPNVVLTAGHCVEESTRYPGFTKEAVELEYLRVMVGSDDISDPTRGTLVGVSKYINRGFFKNVRFPFDNDIALVFLDTCLELVPGKIETIKLSVRKSESACGKDLMMAGYGTDSNLDTALGNLIAKHPLKHSRQTAHSTYTCKDMYVANQKLMQADQDTPETMRKWRESILDDTFLCTSSDNSAVCHGDSGGPLLKMDEKTGLYSQVAIAVSGTVDLETVYCGAGPNIYIRLWGHLEWIEENLKGNSCQPVRDAFTEYPLPPLVNSAEFYLTRCDSKSWQCGSGQCIPKSRWCDGSSDCPDGSDEHNCRPAGRKREVKRENLIF